MRWPVFKLTLLGQFGVTWRRELFAEILQDVKRDAADRGDGEHLPIETACCHKLLICNRRTNTMLALCTGHNPQATAEIPYFQILLLSTWFLNKFWELVDLHVMVSLVQLHLVALLSRQSHLVALLSRQSHLVALLAKTITSCGTTI